MQDSKEIEQEFRTALIQHYQELDALLKQGIECFKQAELLAEEKGLAFRIGWQGQVLPTRNVYSFLSTKLEELMYSPNYQWIDCDGNGEEYSNLAFEHKVGKPQLHLEKIYEEITPPDWEAFPTHHGWYQSSG